MNSKRIFNDTDFGKVFSFYKSRGVRSRLDLFDRTILYVMLGMLFVGAIAVASAYLKAHRNYQYMEISKMIDQRHEVQQQKNIIQHDYQRLTAPESLFAKAQSLHLKVATIDQIATASIQLDKSSVALVEYKQEL